MTRKRKSSPRKPQYEVNIPERSEILALLQDCKAPRNLKHIAKALQVETVTGQAALDKRLKAMLRDGEIIKNRRDGYGLIDKMDLGSRVSLAGEINFAEISNFFPFSSKICLSIPMVSG